jgi:hypothetical protein
VATMLVTNSGRTMMSKFSSPKSHSAPNVMCVVAPAGARYKQVTAHYNKGDCDASKLPSRHRMSTLRLLW